MRRFARFLPYCAAWAAILAAAGDASAQDPAAPAAAAQTAAPAQTTAPAQTAAPAAPSPPKPKTESTQLMAPDRRGAVLRWDLNIEGAIGWLPERGVVTGFGRARAGFSLVTSGGAVGPMRFWTLGAFYDASNLSPATIGVQAESLNISSGTWLQFGGMMDMKTLTGGVMLGAGFSVFGVEVQRRFYDGDGGHGQVWALYGKLRIPVSVIALAMSR